MITAPRLRELLHYDPRTGFFTWRVRTSNRICVGNVAGHNKKTLGACLYTVIRLDRTLYQAHRLAWLYMTSKWPKKELDHIDGNGSNNRWNNLREATRFINNQNARRARKNNQLGILGVSPRKGRFVAQIRVAGKNRFIGSYNTPNQARAAYLLAKRKLHEGCTI